MEGRRKYISCNYKYISKEEIIKIEQIKKYTMKLIDTNRKYIYRTYHMEW